MDLNEIKKALYKEKPQAIKGIVSIEEHDYYYAYLLNGISVEFKVPFSESNFGRTVPAQLLIRWINEH